MLSCCGPSRTPVPLRSKAACSTIQLIGTTQIVEAGQAHPGGGRSGVGSHCSRTVSSRLAFLLEDGCSAVEYPNTSVAIALFRRVACVLFDRPDIPDHLPALQREKGAPCLFFESGLSCCCCDSYAESCGCVFPLLLYLLPSLTFALEFRS